ncbi:hypothetical protein [Leptospira bouyouniensis]|uniref:Uncharacterized protein n=1 Tax=Leptospira bouyouniensis TaxID=2484911 RepID=A0A7I0HMT4_9LEPT|nr:hypothetical protein [Leptospira bouyouniensis]TGL02596.1 hypothetical protein EHQ43_17550 [Leptospira bouyouniensis]TGM74340.1 hypothetical protein EHQ99_19155 [Leptospira bouyouniensis]
MIKKISLKSNFISLFLAITQVSCLYIVPKDHLKYIFLNNLKPKIKNTTIIYKYTYLNFYNRNPYIKTDDFSNRLNDCIRKSFETKFQFANLTILDSDFSSISEIEKSYDNQNVIFLNIMTNEKMNNDFSIKFLKFLNIITFGAIPYWKNIIFTIQINSPIFLNSHENNFQYSFIECGGWLIIPVLFFYENYWELKNKYHNSPFPEVEYMITDSLSKITLKN